MSLVRAFTSRRNKPEMEISAPVHITRAASQRGGRPIARKQISSPMALISTSNTTIHEAQHIVGTSEIDVRNISPLSPLLSPMYSSPSSSDDSDAGNDSIHSNETVTDASSVDDTPVKTEPEPNHLSCYFKPAVDTGHTRTASQATSEISRPSLAISEISRPSLDGSPKIPQRVPSHSKRAHENLHRKRSIQRMLSPPPSRDGHREMTRTSAEIFAQSTAGIFVEIPSENPFGKELAQLEQVAEEFGHVVRDAEADADAVFMRKHGLARFAASDYMFEIQSLIHDMFAEERPAFQEFGFF